MVIKLRPQIKRKRSITIYPNQGYQVYALGLALVQRSNPTLSEALHNTSAITPFVTSGLLPEGELFWRPYSVTKRDQMWVRFVGLRADVVAALDAFTANPGECFQIGHHNWLIETIMWDRHAWAGRSNYVQLMTAKRDVRQIDMEFFTPTTFHSTYGMNEPLPIPSRIFTSLHRRWQAIGGGILHEHLDTFINYYVALSRQNTQTAIVRLKRNGEIGFTGRAMFTIKTSNEKFNKRDAGKLTDDELALRDLLQSCPEEIEKLIYAIGVLSSFAFYSGVGAKTTQGMGMVRML